jgi:hypothetical protein
MSISDLDIYRTANELIRHHAADAWLQAAQFADLCATRHDRAGFNVWVKALENIGLTSSRPSWTPPKNPRPKQLAKRMFKPLDF